jgi:dynein heavy chain
MHDAYRYDRQKQFIKNIRDIQLLQVMAYPGGGRSVITMRLQSRSNLLNITFPAEAQLKRIFSIPLRQKLESFGDDVVALCDGLTKATMNLYFAVCKELLPTPSKSHYLFNLRDMCKILQGLLQAQPSKIGMDPKTSILKLWTHECMRVFSDRLIDPQDTTYFLTQIEEQLVTEPFSSALGSLFDNKVISIYGDFMSDPGQAPKYEEYADFSTVKAFCEGRLEEYNYEPGMVPMQLVLFRDAIEHTCRIARVIGLQRGNAMLVGVGGSGRQSLSRLASFLKGYKTFMIEITKTYRKMEFHEDLKRLYVQTGVQRKETMFLFTDTQIVEESFLEDINGILSTGEVPNLYNPDEISEIREGVLQQARAAGVPETSDALYNFFIEQARNHMHVVLCFSPIGDSFRIRCRKFPGLVSCTSIDWFSEWPIEALTEVAFKFTEEVNLGTDTVKKAVTTMMATAQASVSTVSKRMFAELKRVNYVTPTNYLELVTGYLSLLAERRAKLEDLVRKYVGGVDKIAEAKLEVEEMSKVLVVKKEEVIIASKETEELLVVIVKEKAVADEQEKSVSAEAKKIGQEEVETKVIAQQAQTDLDKAIPALNAAADALNSLEKNHINETKSFKTPPPLVAKVLSAVLILRKASSTDWAEAKRHLSDMNFLQQLKEYDKDNMSDKLLQRIDKYMVDPEFEPEVVAKVSTAASGLCKWVRAMHLYGNVAKTVAPKREKLKTAMMSLEKKQVALKKAQEELQAVVDKVTELQSRYDHSIATKERLTNESATLTRKLERADQLVKGLSGERTRWEGSIEGLQKDIENSVGDCVVAAAFLSYAGAFNTDFRQVLVKETWMPMVEKLSIPTTKGFDFASFLAKPTDVREWNLKGLPGDAFSVENGVLVTRGRRWPLMVDPQAQANKWIKNLESDNGLKVVDLKMSDWMRTMENAIQFGSPVLIQDVLEELDPALEPVLSKSFTKQGNRLVLKLGDKEIDYNEDFKLYLTTKLGNPHYPPEVSTKTTIVNFAIKREGLEDQLVPPPKFVGCIDAWVFTRALLGGKQPRTCSPRRLHTCSPRRETTMRGKQPRMFPLQSHVHPDLPHAARSHRQKRAPGP